MYELFFCILTEIQCICKLDFGKVLWNGLYIKHLNLKIFRHILMMLALFDSFFVLFTVISFSFEQISQEWKVNIIKETKIILAKHYNRNCMYRYGLYMHPKRSTCILMICFNLDMIPWNKIKLIKPCFISDKLSEYILPKTAANHSNLTHRNNKIRFIIIIHSK